MERIREMKKYVLDTSVVIKWFSEYDEDDLDNALNLRNEIKEGRCAIVVPDLLYYEIANALRYNSNFSNSDVKDAVKTVVEMGFQVKGIVIDIMNLAIDLAFKNDCTFYDTYFLALSQTENIPLVTADYKFVKRIKDIENIIKLSKIS